MIRQVFLSGLGLCLGGYLAFLSPVQAQAIDAGDIVLPAGARAMAHRETALGSYALPIGNYSAAGIPLRQQEGHILRRTWQLRGDATVLQVLSGLRQQLLEQGYEVLFQCTSQQCGGFDFRFGIEVVPAPDMVVSLSDYHFLAVAKPAPTEADLIESSQTAESEVASVLVSRSGNATYVQLIEVTPVNQTPLAVVDPTELTPSEPDVSMADALRQNGRVVLDGVIFNSGAVTLGRDSVLNLQPLAEVLNADSAVKVLIVGHTDTIGSLEDNVALSLLRATSVRDALIDEYVVDAEQIQIAGAGFMAPLASNLTSLGRETNRRVEAVLIPE